MRARLLAFMLFALSLVPSPSAAQTPTAIRRSVAAVRLPDSQAIALCTHRF